MITCDFKRSLLIGATTIIALISLPAFSQTGWLKIESVPDKYEMIADSSNRQIEKGVIVLKSTAPDINGFGAVKQNIKPVKYLGKRIRMTADLKLKDVVDWAGIWLRVDQASSQQSLSFDNMHDRPAKGTIDWKAYEIVLDVPDEAANIAFGALLNGTGQIWIKNVNFEEVDDSVPTTGQYNPY